MQLGVASTFEAAGAADKLRGEIGNLFRDGTLAATMAKYSYYGLENEWATYDLMEAAERARWVAWGVGILGIALLVTLWQAASLRQRKRSEAALRASEERFRAIFHQAAVGDAQVTLEGEVTMVNDRYCEVFGYSREELIGKSLVDKTHSDDMRSRAGEPPPAPGRRNPVLRHGDAQSVRKDGGSPGSSCTNRWCGTEAAGRNAPWPSWRILRSAGTMPRCSGKRKALSQYGRRGAGDDLGFRTG